MIPFQHISNITLDLTGQREHVSPPCNQVDELSDTSGDLTDEEDKPNGIKGLGRESHFHHLNRDIYAVADELDQIKNLLLLQGQYGTEEADYAYDEEEQ